MKTVLGCWTRRLLIVPEIRAVYQEARQLVFFWSICLLISTASCKKESVTSPPQSNAISSLTFTYSGDIDGSFSAVGESKGQTSNNVWDYEYAIAGRSVIFLSKAVLIRAKTSEKANAKTRDEISFNIADHGTGSVRLGFDGPSEIIFGSNYGGLPPDKKYSIMDGTVVVTISNKDRIVGTFTGTARRNPLTPTSRDLIITNGKFDMKVLE